MHMGMMDRGFTAYILSVLLPNTLTSFLFTQHKKKVIHLQKKISISQRIAHLLSIFYCLILSFKVLHVLVFCGIMLFKFTLSSYSRKYLQCQSMRVKTEVTSKNEVSLLFTSVHIYSSIFGIHFNRFLEIVICFFEFLLITQNL